MDDDIPELRKSLRVGLRNPKGGADVMDGAGVDITILENDNAAGVLGFGSTSMLAKEGDVMSVNITRSAASHGTVYVDWSVEGKGGLDPANGFNMYNGSLTFLPVSKRKVCVC